MPVVATASVANPPSMSLPVLPLATAALTLSSSVAFDMSARMRFLRCSMMRSSANHMSTAAASIMRGGKKRGHVASLGGALRGQSWTLAQASLLAITARLATV